MSGSTGGSFWVELHVGVEGAKEDKRRAEVERFLVEACRLLPLDRVVRAIECIKEGRREE